MRRRMSLLIIVFVCLGMTGCVSNRAARQEPSMSVTSPATLPPLASQPSTPSSQMNDRAPSRIDSDLAIPQEYLENLGLVPSDAGADTFYQVARRYYDGTALFRNDWLLPESASGNIAYVRDSRYVFSSHSTAEEFLQNIHRGLIPEMEDRGGQSEELEVSLGDVSYATAFSWPDQRAYALQFMSGQTVAIVIIFGSLELSEEQALAIFSFAAHPATFNRVRTVTPLATNGGFEAVTGEWSKRNVVVVIEPDGSGRIQLTYGSKSGVIHELNFDMQSSPLTAKIVDQSFYGDMRPTESEQVGDVLIFDLEKDQSFDVLVVTMPDLKQVSNREIRLCRNGGYDLPCK